jgi:hypothetical protein
MPHFKAFAMINLQYEFGKKFLMKPQMTKTSIPPRLLSTLRLLLMLFDVSLK